MLLPLDILREISLYLPHYLLSASKELNNIYNELWFKDKILLQYPKCKISDFSWKDLYRKSLKQGKIYEYVKDKKVLSLPIEGIKMSHISTCNIESYMILTFDENLWLCNLNKDGSKWVNSLVDINVSDISDRCYIKENELYSLYLKTMEDNEPIGFENKFDIVSNLRPTKFEIKFKSIVKAETNFIAVYKNNNTICAITNNKLYCYGIGVVSNFCIDCSNNKNISITSGSERFMIQNCDGSIKIFNHFPVSIGESPISDVISISSGTAKLLDGSLIEIYIDWDNKLTCKILFDNCNELEKYCFNRGRSIMLINGNVYNMKQELLCENVKNIFENYNDNYFVIMK